MTRFESSKKSCDSDSQTVFGFLSDFHSFSQMLPRDKVKDWECTSSTCRFSVNGLGQVGLIISGKEPFRLVQYTGDGKVPFDFHLVVHLQATGPQQCMIHLEANAQLNPMLKLIASGPIQQFLETLVTAIAGHRFD